MRRGSGDGFDPPYVLGSKLALLFGTFESRAPLGEVPEGLVPLSLFGKPIGLVVLADYDEPPAAMPVRYHEVIVSVVVRRGLRLGALPLSMQLDAELPVRYGREHYGMPKVLDPSLELLVGDALRASGEGLFVEGVARGPLARLLAFPLSAGLSLGLRAMTRLMPVLGFASSPARRAIVALDPSFVGQPMHATHCELPVGRLRVWWTQRYERCSTWLGPPSDWEGMNG